MANTLLTPSVIAKAALANLYANAVMPALVHRDYDGDFAGKVGDTITVRKPATFTSGDFDPVAGITVQDATESGVPVVLNHHLDVSFSVTTKELSLEIDDFTEQFIAPAMEAHAQKIDQLLLGLRADVTQTVGVNGATPADIDILIDGRKKLNDANVPLIDRHGVFSTATEAAFLKDSRMVNADQRGDTVGLQEASLGRKFGFDMYVDQNITDGDSVLFHRSAFALVSRTLAKPLGKVGEQTAIVNYKGFGLRVVYDYDVSKKKDVISIDCLVGVKTLDAARAAVILG